MTVIMVLAIVAAVVAQAIEIGKKIDMNKG